jgi:GH24 family phage-related lysozyme (muramidase)
MAVMFIAEHEGCVLRVYDDAYPGKILRPGEKAVGVLTAGYGHTSSRLIAGQVITAVQAKEWLEADCQVAAVKLSRVLTRDLIGELTEHQYSALISFVFNVGADPKWTIWKRLTRRQFEQVPIELMKFVNATIDGQKVKVQGLVNRRAAEVALWSTDEPGSVPDEPPSSATRAGDTPPTPADPVPPSRSKALIAGAIGAASGVGPVYNQIEIAIKPMAQHSSYVQTMLAVLAAIAAACAAVAIVYTFIQKRNARN